jgi:hypothetical protein
MVAVASVIFVFYAMRGIDRLQSEYIGYFYWAVPLVVLLVFVAAVVPLVPRSRYWRSGSVALCAIVVLVAMRGSGLENVYRGNAALPSTVRAMADARPDGRGPLVLTVDQVADHLPMWPDAFGVIVQADQDGIRACMADEGFEFMVTEEFVCSDADLASGTTFVFRKPGSGVGPVLARAPLSEIALRT